jgi:hypothetical protein
MASSSESPTETRCIGCGNDAISSKRRLLSTPASSKILPGLKEMFMRWFESKNIVMEEEDLAQLINRSYLCRACYRSYESYLKQQLKLMEGLDKILSEMFNSDDPPCSTPAQPHSIQLSEPPSKRLKVHSQTSHQQSSAPVSVSVI